MERTKQQKEQEFSEQEDTECWEPGVHQGNKIKNAINRKTAKYHEHGGVKTAWIKDTVSDNRKVEGQAL